MGGSLQAQQRPPRGRAVPPHPAVRRMTRPLDTPLVHLVDDDQAVRDSLALLIGTIGLRVRTWADPLAFLREVDREAIGAIVLDVRMPGLGGLQVLDTAGGAGVDQPVVLLTGHGTVEMCRRAFKSGAAEFLEKPVDDDLLLETLQQAVRQHVRSRERSQADRAARDARAAVRARTRGAGAGRRGAHQQGDRQGAGPVAAHGGDAPRPPVREARGRFAGPAGAYLRIAGAGEGTA
jgi:two-component system response regulator FixJ